MKTKLLIATSLLAIGAAVIIISGRFIQTGTAPGIKDDKIQITASFYPLYFFASEIAGDRAIVYNLTPAGAEPHDYELTARDRVRVEDSRLLILNGNKLEGWGEKIKDSLSGSGVKIISVGEGDITGLETGEDISLDPHTWLSPHFAEKEVLAIALAMKEIDPANAVFYESNAMNLRNILNDLDKKFHIGLHDCRKNEIVTAHAAFGHLASEYGLNQVAISGISPDDDPSPQKLAETADFARKNGVEYIFFENLVSPKLAETVAEEIGARTLTLNPLEGLSEAEMAIGKNYFTEMENNLLNLKIVLQCP